MPRVDCNSGDISGWAHLSHPTGKTDELITELDNICTLVMGSFVDRFFLPKTVTCG